LSGDWLKTKANGGTIYNSNGYDIIFRDVNNNQLDHEIEYYDGVGSSGGGGSFPQVASVTETTFSADTTNHYVAMPATVAAGDLLLVLFTNDGDATVTTPGGWTQINTLVRSTYARGSIFAKDAVGNEGGTTVNFQTSLTEQAAAQVYRILAADWYGDIANGIASASFDPGAVQTPDPPSLNPAAWDVEKTLWIAYAAGSAWTSVTSYPTNYTNGRHIVTTADTTGASASSARRESEAASEDPGIFTMSESRSGVVFTIAIRPSSGGGSGTGGKLVSWVRIPTLFENNQDTVIYMYYGNSHIYTPTANPTGVWDSSFKGVWHLHGNNYGDSTSNNNDGTNYGSDDATGHIANGQDFISANSDYIQTTSNEMQAADNFTISLWFNADATDYAHHLIWEGNSSGDGWGESYSVEEMHISMGNYVAGNVNNVLSFFLGDRDAQYEDANNKILNISTPFTDITNWHQVAVSVSNMNTSPSATMYLDGSSVGSDTGTTSWTGRSTWNTDLRFGRPGTSTRYFDGVLDEVRISTVARDACWIETEYSNYNSPSTFASIGTGEEFEYKYRKRITVLNSMTPASCTGDLSNFPVLIDLSGDWLKTEANGGNISHPYGYDIVFKAEDGETKLDHEIELYDGSATGGKLLAWVRIPTLKFDTDTVIYMYYGNPRVTSPTENPAGVWDDNYVGVWHLKETGSGAAGEYKDSTQYANHGQGGGGTPGYVPSLWSGTEIIDGAQDFDGTDDRITCGNDSELNITGNITVEAWVQLQDVRAPTNGASIVGKRQQYFLFQDWDADYRITFTVDTPTQNYVSANGNSPNTWYHMVGVYDGSNIRIYRNGSQVGSVPTSGSITVDNYGVEIGRHPNNDPFDGPMDEVRISNIARNACWIGTSYTNQNSPSTSLSVEGQEHLEFDHRKRITILDSMTPDSCTGDLSNFPVHISLSGDWLKTVANGGDIYSADGYDIIFRAQDGVTKLDHEIEKYDGSVTGGKLLAWVRIPALSYNANTIIYVYYGNEAITTSQAYPAGVWDSNYKGVWHFAESSGDALDSTSHGTNGALSGGVTQGATGKVGPAYAFNGTDGQVDMGDPLDGHLDFGTGSLTVEIWINRDSSMTTDQYGGVFKGNGNVAGQAGWLMRFRGDDRVRFSGGDGTASVFNISQSDAITSSEWIHFAGVLDRSAGKAYVYKNGQFLSEDTSITGGNIDSSVGLRLARDWSSDQYWFKGLFDEVRISKIARDSCWIEAEHSNQSNPDGFYTIGIEEQDETDGDPLQNGWTYRKRLTIDASRVAGDLTNFPVLISTTDADWREDDLYEGHVAQDDGGDIIFTAGDGITKLDHEIEKYNPETGELVAWVEVRWLSSTTNTDIYIYYGNTSLTEDENQENPAGVWDANYKLVQHLQEETPDPHEDSTSNNNDSTSVSVTTQGSATGKIDGADEFDGNDDVISIASANSLNLSNDFTLECWAKRSEFSTNSYVMLSKLYDPQYSWKLSFDVTDNYIRFDVYDTSIANYVSVESFDMAVTDTNWHHVVARSDNGTLNLFLDGSQSNQTNSIGANVRHDSEPLYIGASKWTVPGDWFQGLLDEARISNVARSAEWIQTEYNNQRAPAAFYTVGIEEVQDVGGNPLNNGWSHRKKISILASEVAADLINFPLLIKTTNSEWADTLHGGHVAQGDDGGDILFTASDGMTKLDH